MTKLSEGFYRSKTNGLVLFFHYEGEEPTMFVPSTGEFSAMYDMSLFDFCPDQEAQHKEFDWINGWLTYLPEPENFT